MEPKTIYWDIETSFNVAAVFRLFGEDYIPFDNLLQERYIICAAWKAQGEKAVHAVSTADDAQAFAADPHNDRAVCEKLHAVLSKADVIIAHNGDRYDIKFTEARMLFHGLSPLPPITSIDTLKVAKKRFLFNSNKLDYLGQFLGVGRKKPTPKGLWLKVLAGDRAAVKTMVAYNKQDVLLLESVFLKLRPYVTTGINRGLLGQQGCPRCGSAHIHARGATRTATQTYQRYQCQDCGGWFRERKAAQVRPTMRGVA